MDDQDVPVVAAIFNNRYEAELVLGILKTEGILAALRADDAGGLHPQLGVARGIKVMVRPKDLPLARKLLETSGAGEEEALLDPGHQDDRG